MSAVHRLVPRPYMLESLVNAELDWLTALSEFVDNSLGEAAGAARTVTIIIDRDSLIVDDNGVGVQDLEQCFKLGDSTSRYSRTDIGRYGVGSKHASVWIGKRYRVTTNRGGQQRTFQVNWHAMMKGEEWAIFRPRVMPSVGVTGTTVTVSQFWPGRKRLHIDYVTNGLGETFAPALMDGRRILLVDQRSRVSKTHALQPWRPRDLQDVVHVSGKVGERSYTAEVGIMDNHYSTDSGLRLCFSHRVITTCTRLAGQSLPARIFGYVRLAPEWKDRLSAHKRDVVDSDDLEESLLHHPELARLFALANEYQQTLLIENIAAEIEGDMNKAVTLKRGGEQLITVNRGHHRDGDTPPNPNPGPDNGPRPVELPNADGDGDDPAVDLDSRSGLKLKVQPLGSHRIGFVEDSESELAVVINSDCPLCMDAFQDAMRRRTGYYPGLIGIIGNILSLHVGEQGGDWLERRFQIPPSPTQLPAIERLLLWWFFTVAPQIKEAHGGAEDEPRSSEGGAEC